MAGARQHTIPRFLLKGFASRVRGREVYAWRYEKGRNGSETNIKNISVGRNFYGKPGASSLDEEISSLEGRYSTLIEQLRDPDSERAALTDRRLPGLVAHLAIRTRQLRAWVLDMTSEAIAAMEPLLTNEALLTKVLCRKLERDPRLRAKLEAALKEHGLDGVPVSTVIQKMRPRLMHFVAACMPEIKDLVRKVVSLCRSQMPDALRDGFIKSLSGRLEGMPRSERYESFSWSMLRSDHPVILPDTVCVFQTKGAREFKPLDDVNDEVIRVILPVSARAVLIGSSSQTPLGLPISAINVEMAKCSYEFGVSSSKLLPGSILLSEIGANAGILSPSEVDSIKEEMLGKLADPETWMG